MRQDMVSLGVHVSTAGGLDLAAERAQERGCDAFQIFTTNPRGWNARPIPEEVADRFTTNIARLGLNPAVSHMPYLPNLASSREEVYARSIQALGEELRRCSVLRIPYLVTHLGSHLGSGRSRGLVRVVQAIKEAFTASPGEVMLLLENGAGTKNSMGSYFSDIEAVLFALSDERERIGVCLDTCHLHAAGYDLSGVGALDATLDQFRYVVGIERLKLIHLNDCRGAIGSHLDRHEHIGLGRIGMDGMKAVLTHPQLRGLPMILETPQDERRDDRGNLALARELASTAK